MQMESGPWPTRRKLRRSSPHRRSCEESGKQAGEVILQGLISWAETDDEALENSREWKPTLVDANYAEGNHTTEQVAATAQNVSDDKFRIMGIISADPDIHIKKIKLLSAMGATAIVLMNVSGKDPHGTLRLYGEELLPKLRG
jgi:coenzyme F420-dependent glucose-6-phosphate dehydrogenase